MIGCSDDDPVGGLRINACASRTLRVNCRVRFTIWQRGVCWFCSRFMGDSGFPRAHGVPYVSTRGLRCAHNDFVSGKIVA